MRENRAQLQRVEEAEAKVEEELADIPRLEDHVQQFKETDVPTRLADLRRLDKDESVFTEGSQRIVAARQSLQPLSDPQTVAAVEADFDEVEDSPLRSFRLCAVRRTRTPGH